MWRRWRTALATLAVLIAALLCGVGPAAAGGPTSLLLVVPGDGRTASAYVGSFQYERLAEILNALSENGTGRSTAPEGRDAGKSVTLTWLIHDVQVWRVDRVYPGVLDGTTWIASQTWDGGSGSIWDSPVFWHSTTRTKELTGLLNQLGVDPSGATVPDTTAATAGQARAADPTSIRNASIWDEWPLGAAGLSLGVLLGLIAGRWRPRRRRGSTVEPDDRAADTFTLDLDVPDLVAAPAQPDGHRPGGDHLRP